MSENLARILKNFEHATKDHGMTVMVDDGLRRHLRFQTPGTWSYCFDVITWRGHLCYTGDLGTYVFSRIDDMFEFFRSKKRTHKHVPVKYTIDPDYWAEKLLSVDRHGGLREYSADRFRQAVKERYQRAVESNDIDWTKELKVEFWKELEDRVLSSADYREDAMEIVRNFESHVVDLPGIFHDFWETTLDDYTTRYILCCYALQWAIHKYDCSKQGVCRDSRPEQEAEAKAGRSGLG